jgi:RNA polymerase sigma factor (sigma-70 family)
MKENKLKTYTASPGKKTLQGVGTATKNPLANMSDFDLWKNFKGGDEASFIFIYKKYFPQLFQFGNQFTSKTELVEDSIQDLFIELREKREKITIKSSIKFYLFKSLKRKIIALLEKNKKNVSLEETPGYTEFQISYSAEKRLIDSQIEKEQRQKLSESMQNLSPRQREALYYFYYEDMSYSEIQELMNFKHIQATRNLMYRALKVLKSSLTAVYSLLISTFLVLS